MLEAVDGPGSLKAEQIYAGLEFTAIDITRRSAEVFLPAGFDLDSG